MSEHDQAAAGVEPWLRGTRTEVKVVQRAVVHALELAGEDAERCCSKLSEAEWNARPHGLPSVAFQVLHTAGSLDRLLTYARGQQLMAGQLAELRAEGEPVASGAEALERLHARLAEAIRQVVAMDPETFEDARWVGRKRLPTSVGGLLVHLADHTQRHVGQMVTSTKLLRAMRAGTGV